MSCILRASGKTFDVDGFIRETSLIPDSIWQKGTKRFPTSTTRNTINESSGIRIVASGADFSELQKQIEDAIVFLENHLEAVKTLTSYPGVEGAVLDFGAEIYPPGWASFTFPSELVSLAGLAGVSLCISVYPTENETGGDTGTESGLGNVK